MPRKEIAMDYDLNDDEQGSDEGRYIDQHELPDPNGPVAPITNTGSTSFSLKQLLAGVGFGCLGLGLLGPALMSGSCAGATRSSRLNWQEQQEQIHQAISEQTVDDGSSPAGETVD
jgi:hypothetical protein